ncbi:MauE/DoxX family redox-associated membrane protein [Prosthecomicrobium sp. N25]|uniref:MauE/DoxX family redox-associated membrane protein n=1 Tax=Prosthecomicrobium sp. N25 TaxID=3129254 RepID=UPI003077BF7A
MAGLSVPLDPLATAAAVGLLVLVFARALLHKAADFAAFRQSVEDYRVVPASVAGPAALALGAAELAVTLGLLLPATRVPAALGAIGLLALYAGAMAANLLRGRTAIDCGCGGPGQPIGWILVGRNAVLAAAAALVLLPVAPRSLGILDMIAVPVMVLATWLVILAVEQLARSFAHIRHMRESGIE